ncbi:hypothetical protein [Halopiger xanaduensis]|uniref:Uncharacterized protein n=1 Tax=Halopiger xanaduensis (strain DSM 18323 / JCM 14033 / SH-6) TaxID=797210 RepID=F8DEK9_HALXS|nr:hypothetical protein [Halopiger xanaduensis]AEH39296.1 hypothetical protein Halxa_0043 [Halopiger xanaduensis SH-6]
MPDHKVSQTRRTVLKSAAGLSVLTIGFEAGAGTAAADPSQFKLGTVHFVEAREEYDAPSDAPVMARTGTAGYALDQSQDVVTLTTAPVSAFSKQNVVISAGGDYYSPEQAIPITESDRKLPVDTNYRELNARYAVVDQIESKPPVSVQVEKDNLQMSSSGIDLEVPVGEEVEGTGDSVSIASSGTSVTPDRKLQVRNHGEMTVFGHEDYLILPTESDDSYAQARVASLQSLVDEHVREIEDVDLIAVPKDVDIVKGGE